MSKSFKIELILEAFFSTGFQAPRSIDQAKFLRFFFFFKAIYRELGGGRFEPNVRKARETRTVPAWASRPAVRKESCLGWSGVLYGVSC